MHATVRDLLETICDLHAVLRDLHAVLCDLHASLRDRDATPTECAGFARSFEGPEGGRLPGTEQTHPMPTWCQSPSLRLGVGRLLLSMLLEVSLLPGSGAAEVLAEITRPVAGRPMRASSGLFDPESNRDAHHVRAGQRFVLAELEGPGEIRHLWFTLASRDRRYPRTMVLRVFYDGSGVPSVESPIGDFFCAGNGMKANVSSIPVEVSSYGRALNCYWRMPFRRRCVIEVHNQSRETCTVYFQCDWLKLDALPEDAYYFHARYRQEYPAAPFSWYTLFEGEGEGQYVGTVFSSQNTVASWFGEADDRFYVDGEEVPSIIGTGTEDYFNDAWNLRLTAHGRVGTTICETKGDERRVTAYRWHLEDPVPFKKSLKVEIERRSFLEVADPETGKRTTHDFKYRPDYCSSVAFWYQRGIARPTKQLAPVEERVLPEVWIEPAWIIDKVRTSPGLAPRNAANRTCNLNRFFYLRNDEVGGWVELPVTLPERGRYAVSVFQNLYKHFGIWKVTLRGEGFEKVLAERLDFRDYLEGNQENWPENFHHGTTVETKVGTHTLGAGDYYLRFECVGANPLSEHPETGEFGNGYSLGLDAIDFRRLSLDDPHAWMQDYLQKEETLLAAWQREAGDTVAALAKAAADFRRDAGAYPHTLAELLGTPHWTGDRTLLDPWHQPYCYREPGVVHPGSFDVWSVHGNSRDPSTWIGNWRNPLALANEVAPGWRVFEGESLEAARRSAGAGTARQQTASYGNAPLSGTGLLFLRLDAPGDWVEVELPGKLAAGKYQAYALPVTSWDYGLCQWSLNGTPLGAPFDAHSQTLGVEALPGTVVALGEGPSVLRIEATGKDEYANGHNAGLDALVLKPLP
ncbi:MAG: hypothetical protein COZ06_20365 [Armatimonadetes bacterium CG_4_10_14_3_um_filter_66_18]|nr:DUF2961 domain-containing protein [Armatimonadota bacterium]OIP04647.1 MAG: hypothetical protein AUJ96_12285 [Armatimonadetes bacterium CG2_30_66_41]PIU94170.1 MAG: hypothetical protein COS65_08980 [Armatimonadetes bacterium CG06_land_8_20_14_3_00_66_21]PIW20405.1 MAG: hypothetical protein COW34_01915 [Armatimonadetes bacterium CG17_big_fil_post_rev_8_21_14_2_50_66_6]PIX37375.1 MAG: hypothetical protein COZ57_34670 [Armatimonadetes bacterium CG_4_8_14_3_um_filter_66_20]PIY44500.1 MAG: hypot